MRWWLFFLLLGSLSAQPDAPSAVRTPDNDKVVIEAPQSRFRANAEVYHDRVWITSTAAYFLSTVFDLEATHAGIAHHRCTEGHINPPYPSRAELYRVGMGEVALVGGVNFLLLKSKVWRWVPATLSGALSVAHVQGGASWMGRCW